MHMKVDYVLYFHLRPFSYILSIIPGYFMVIFFFFCQKAFIYYLKGGDRERHMEREIFRSTYDCQSHKPRIGTCLLCDWQVPMYLTAIVCYLQQEIGWRHKYWDSNQLLLIWGEGIPSGDNLSTEGPFCFTFCF